MRVSLSRFEVEVLPRPDDINGKVYFVEFSVFIRGDGDPMARGTLRWDGCLELGRAIGLHLCSRSDAREFAEAIDAVYEHGRAMMRESLGDDVATD